MKLQVNYILQTMEKMAELRIDTIEPRSSTHCFFSAPVQLLYIQIIIVILILTGKIVPLTSKVRWVNGPKDETSQLNAGETQSTSNFLYLYPCALVQVLVQEQQGDQLHPVAGEPAAVLVDDQAS